jgi:hypothetical protein
VSSFGVPFSRQHTVQDEVRDLLDITRVVVGEIDLREMTDEVAGLEIELVRREEQEGDRCRVDIGTDLAGLLRGTIVATNSAELARSSDGAGWSTGRPVRCS